MSDVYVLAIESSCDETAAAVIKNGREVLSNVISSQIEIHKLYGGVVPEIASRHHLNNVNTVVDQAMEEAGDKMDANQKAETQKLRDELQKALDDNDIDAMRTKLDMLEKAAQAASASMYQNQGAGNANGGYSAGSNNDDNVVDAEFEEKH